MLNDYIKHIVSLQVTTSGQVIGGVLAKTKLQAQKAARAVRVEYKELKPIISIDVRHKQNLNYCVDPHFHHNLLIVCTMRRNIMDRMT